MGLKKLVQSEAAVVGTAQVSNPLVESGSQAALDRLKATVANAEAKAAVVERPRYVQRDADATARGKTRCVQFEAALMSPAIAGMQFNTMEEYLKLVKQAADAGVAYSFEE